MNYEKFLELLKNEEVQEKIKDLYCKLDKERFTEGSGMGSGWGWTIILEQNGEIDYMYGSNNSMRMDVYEGTSMEIAFLKDDAEVWTESMGDVKDVKDYKEFIKHLEDEFEFEYSLANSEEDENYEEKKQEYIEENATLMNYHEFNQEGFQEVERETWEAICDINSYDTITDIIHNAINQLEEHNEYYNSFEQDEF